MKGIEAAGPSCFALRSSARATAQCDFSVHRILDTFIAGPATPRAYVTRLCLTTFYTSFRGSTAIMSYDTRRDDVHDRGVGGSGGGQDGGFVRARGRRESIASHVLLPPGHASVFRKGPRLLGCRPSEPPSPRLANLSSTLRVFFPCSPIQGLPIHPDPKPLMQQHDPRNLRFLGTRQANADARRARYRLWRYPGALDAQSTAQVQRLLQRRG